MPPDIDLSRATHHPLTPGLVGALIGLRWAPGATWVQRVVNVVSGSAISAYMGPVVAEWLSLTSPAMQSGLGFALGLFGISVATVAMEGLRTLKLGEIAADWLRRR